MLCITRWGLFKRGRIVSRSVQVRQVSRENARREPVREVGWGGDSNKKIDQ